MAIIVNSDTRVITQGITGSAGSFHTKQCIDYGTNVVGGVVPGKGGQTFEDTGIPIFDTVEEAITMANDTNYGLSAGVFTQNVDWALKFAQEVHSGNINVNWGPQWRADLMPYGGFKDSGMGKEGPKYAVEEMTELKMVIFH